MGDIVDRAAVAEEAHREAALQQHRQSVPVRPVNTSGLCCECGLGIGKQRLLASPTVIRCIDCQSEHERNKKRAR